MNDRVVNQSQPFDVASLANDGYLRTAARIKTTREAIVDTEVIVPRTYCPTCGAPK